MKAIIALLTYLIFSLMTHAQTSQDETQIKSLVQYMEDGWNKKDGNLFAKGFAENADYVIINGMQIKGKQAIAGSHQAIFNDMYKETTARIETKNIRYIRPDVAIVHVQGHLKGVSFGKPIDHKAVITMTLQKTTAGWQIDAFQNTRIEEQPPRSN